MKKTTLTIALPFAMALLFAATPATADPVYDIRHDTNLWEHSFGRGNIRCHVKEGDRITRDWGQNWSRWIYGRHSRYDTNSSRYLDTGCHGWFNKNGQDESRIRIVPYISHDPVSPAHTAGTDDNILDQCDGLELTCTKNVWVTVRPETQNGQPTYVPYDVEVDLYVGRSGPFFPNHSGGRYYRHEKVTIPAGRPGDTPFAKLKIPLALDSTPEYDAGTAGNYAGIGEATAKGFVSAYVYDLKYVGKGDDYYFKGPRRQFKAVSYSIYDKAVENMPEFWLVAQNSTVQEGSPVTFELRGNKSPNFKMRIRMDLSFPNGDRFFDLDRRYRYVFGRPNSGVYIGNGEYRFSTYNVGTFLNLEDNANGVITARIGYKKTGWNWNDQSWGLQPRERASVTVTVNNSRTTDIIDITHASSVVEGGAVVFQLTGAAAPVLDQRIRVDFAYAGDFFGSTPAHTYVNIGPNLGSVNGNGTYKSDRFEISTVLDLDSESNGSVTATIGEKRLGHSDNGELIALTAEERAISSTVIVEDSVIPIFRIVSASRDQVSFVYSTQSLEGRQVYFLLLGDEKPNVSMSVQMDYAYTGDFFGESPIESKVFDLRPNVGNGFSAGGYLLGYSVHQTLDDGVDEPDGSITASIRSVEVGPSGNRLEVEFAENEHPQSASITILDNDENNYQLEALSPTITAGDMAQWQLVSSAQTAYATSITVRYADVGSTTLFGDYPPASETISMAAGSGSEIADRPGVFLQDLFLRGTHSSTTGGSIDAAITSITETVPGTDGTTTTRTNTIPIEEQTLVRVTINGQSSSHSRSLGAMHAYREVSGSHESDVVDEGTEGTQEQISLAFDRPSTLDVQAFVETVGTSINSGADLSELVNMPSFSMPLTSGTEVTGPLTMWIDSNDSDTLAVGHIGMDLSMYDSYVFGMTVSSLESELSEDISEDMNMVQSYLAYKPEDSDVHVSAIVGFGAGDLSMEEFGSFETSRMLAQFGIHGDLASYGTESIDGSLKVDATAGISEHTVLETDQYYGWSTIGRNASIAASSEHAISTPVGTFNPTIWTEFDSRLESGGGLTFDDLNPHGLSMSAWINGETPDTANDFTADVKYGFSTTDSVVITPSLELATNNGISHTLGVSIANDSFEFGGDVTDNSRYGINGAIRW